MKCVEVISLVSLLFLCGGCVILPIPTPGNVASDSPRLAIEQKGLEFMKVGSTTREDVLLRLGEPDKYGPTWRVQFEYRWKMVTGYLFVGAYRGPAHTFGFLEENTLHIEFDEKNVLKAFEIEKIKSHK